MLTMTAGESALATIFPNVTAQRVRCSMQQRRPLQDHGPLERLAGLAEDPIFADARTLIRQHRGRVRLHLTQSPAHYRADILVAPGEALAFLDHGVSMNIEGIEASVPAVDGYVGQLSEDLGIPRQWCFCSAFVSATGSGLPLHFDNKEVIAVQIRGRKRWQIAENLDVAFPTANYAMNSTVHSAELCRYFRPEQALGPTRCENVDLQPGSVLFLPRGYWHGTAAEQESISLSFGFAVPTWTSVFLDRLRSALVVAEPWRAPAVRLDADGGQFVPEDLSAAMDQAISALLSGEFSQRLHDEVLNGRASSNDGG
jgi:ribosomal protein L16 Arg81 hydroxylase